MNLTFIVFPFDDEYDEKAMKLVRCCRCSLRMLWV
ncbi:hypothetical protein BVRB_7g170460 [Beta vulgaris subsp. vulgaris]|nr:hypothetical protein BVRB_7g170460 [Beta vulgaris subsp. vulgaris]